MDEKEYTLMEHLRDLRVRIVRALLGVIFVSLFAYGIADHIINIFMLPIKALVARGQGLLTIQVISPAEYMISEFKVAIMVGLFIASPWVMYQAWQFLAPGLYKHEKKWALSFVWVGALFFIAGGCFAYFVVFPNLFEYLLLKSVDQGIATNISVAEQMSFSIKLLIAFGVVFETPVVVFILSMVGIIDPRNLSQYRPYVIVVGFILGAVLTPPDLISQSLLAVPLILLYELGVLVSIWVLKIKGDTPLKRGEKQ